MTPRERVMAALNKQPLDRFPVDIWHTPEVYGRLAAHFGVDDEIGLYRAMGLDKIMWRGIGYVTACDPETRETGQEGAERTAWGAELVTVDTGVAVYQEIAEPPLAGHETVESIDEYAHWPDPDRFDYAGVDAWLAESAPEFVTNVPWVSFYEIYCQMRGMETAMIDLLIAPDYVEAVMDRIEHVQTRMLTRLLGQCGDRIDCCFISDDMGGQSGLLISLELWDRHLKDRMRRWCELLHKHEVKVFYHSDGAIAELIPRLIDAGIDVLNPIQHVCPGMDMANLKKMYGDRLVFHGGVDNQRVLAYGDMRDVRRETESCLRQLGADGTGYICASCHNIQPVTPVDNILAMVDTVHNYTP